MFKSGVVVVQECLIERQFVVEGLVSDYHLPCSQKASVRRSVGRIETELDALLVTHLKHPTGSTSGVDFSESSPVGSEKEVLWVGRCEECSVDRCKNCLVVP